MNAILETIEIFWPALVAGVLVALTCSVLGVFVVGRRMVLVGVALPQVAAAGIGLSFLASMHAWSDEGSWLHFTRSHDLMAVLACVVGLVALVGGRGPGKLPASVPIGGVFALAGALAVLFVQASAQGMEELRNLVAGDILFVHEEGLLELFLVLGGVLAALGVGFRRQVFTAFDAETATTLGVRTRLHEFIFRACLAVAVARCVHEAGTLYVFAYLVLPAATGLLLGTSVPSMFLWAGATAVVGSFSGFLLAADERVDWPVGPTATVTVCLLLAAAWGWTALRRR